MTTLFLAILAGTVIGYVLRRREKVIQVIDRALWGVIFLLLLLLGFAIGRNPEVMNSLVELGFYALLLALGSLFGSVIVTAGLNRLFKLVA
ncbi:MAG: LysO family transporter [Chloroflexi bacterium]|nr:LysO family transporter [Chloroflexota bacterium]